MIKVVDIEELGIHLNNFTHDDGNYIWIREDKLREALDTAPEVTTGELIAELYRREVLGEKPSN